jgi:exopolyphosphatase/guanosine-5'-triphosphate,3'-diphosphate pyrophosphatase
VGERAPVESAKEVNKVSDVHVNGQEHAPRDRTGNNCKKKRGRRDQGTGQTGARGGARNDSAPRLAPHPEEPPVYAALDLGTNNCRLLVARPSRRGFVVVDAFSRIIRLGEGVSSSGRLSEAAMQRTIEALQVCSRKMERRGVRRSRLIATQACRIAENADAFIDRVRGKTGLELEIINQETEARLAVTGCASLLEADSTGALVFDIGGGSSELIWLDLRGQGGIKRHSLKDRLAAQSSIKCWTSLPIGVVTISERFGGYHVTPQVFEAMVEYVMGLLQEFEDQNQIADQLADPRAYLLGTSGTVTTLAGIYLGLPYYDRAKVDGCWLNVEDVRDVSRVLVQMSYEKRAAQPCIGTERADLVLGGCAILEAMLRVWPCQRLRVADRGLREGILATLMAEDNLYLSSLPYPPKGRQS